MADRSKNSQAERICSLGRKECGSCASIHLDRKKKEIAKRKKGLK